MHQECPEISYRLLLAMANRFSSDQCFALGRGGEATSLQTLLSPKGSLNGGAVLVPR